MSTLARVALTLPLVLCACRDDNLATMTGTGSDLSAPAAPPDLATTGPGGKPLGGMVTTSGGSVDRLFFGFTGDTRPSNMDDTAGYPTATITQIFSRLAQADVQFALDLGDHMYIVGNTADAPVQMGMYMTAAQQLGSRPLFMTLGNHDCGQGNCFYAQTDPNYTAYMAALKPVSNLPYFSFTVTTRSGPAVFVVFSDNFSSTDEFDWFEKTLAAADGTARYTIVMRHHPLGESGTTYQVMEHSLAMHKYALFLTGHSHKYQHDPNDPTGRTVIYGLGGVPNSGHSFGYGTVQQGPDDRLYVTVYESGTNMPIDMWSVGPNP